MKHFLWLLSGCLVLLFFPQSNLALEQNAPEKKPIRQWWNERWPGRPLNRANAKKLPRIAVKGNKFVDPQGNPILFRGVSISDPDKIESQGRWNKELFAKVKEMGTRLVRIPIHPVAWRERTPTKYLELLDQAVEWCTDLEMYVIIDWHSIGNLKTELFQDPMYNTSLTETFDFWRTMARHFKGHNTVAFFEIFNEPTLGSNQFGRVTWDEWKAINEDIIRIIRAFDAEVIPLLAGFDWAYDLTPLRINPIEAARIGYVTHPYPMKRTKPWEPKWEEDFGFAADQYPIVATEFGFMPRRNAPPGGDEYGNAIINYLEGRGISWVAWVFDPEWGPRLLESWDNFKLSPYGEFIQKSLQGPRSQAKP
jgi:endoglucanase